jgi:hypothetical protein
VSAYSTEDSLKRVERVLRPINGDESRARIEVVSSDDLAIAVDYGNVELASFGVGVVFHEIPDDGRLSKSACRPTRRVEHLENGE